MVTSSRTTVAGFRRSRAHGSAAFRRRASCTSVAAIQANDPDPFCLTWGGGGGRHGEGLAAGSVEAAAQRMLRAPPRMPAAMPRQPRPDLPDIAQHVVQRGNDRLPCFFTEADYRRYLIDLRDAALEHACAIHAYVLMTNHVHLLVTPTASGNVSRMMQSLGRRYVAYVNTRHQRTGTLWEGRYKACLVDSERYALACLRYIELNPVRAAMVASPQAHRWSSYHANALGHGDPLVTPHPAWLALGADAAQRRHAYRALFEQAIGADRLAEIRAYLQQQRVLGTPRFQAQIAAQLGREVTLRARGHPKK